MREHILVWNHATALLLYCVDPFIIFNSPLSVSDWSHLEQANGVFHALSKCHSSWMSCHISNRQMTSLLCDPFMIFKSQLSVNDWSHFEQVSGVLHALWKCHSSWMSFHISNRQMASLLCGSFQDFQITTIFKWLVTFGTSKWSLACSFKVPLQLNVLSHFKQANDFSPVWILSWLSNHNYL